MKLQNQYQSKKCEWNAYIYIEKPLLTVMNKVAITLYDQHNNEICYGEEKTGVITLW